MFLTPAAMTLLAVLVGGRMEPPSHFDRIRTADRKIVELLDHGYRRSPSFRRLVDALERSDLVVYVEFRRDGLVSSLNRVLSAGGRRYVWISIVRDRGVAPLTALLAHELQHAVEVATAPEVVDDATLAGLYRRRPGASSGVATGSESYETEAAQEVEATVLRELVRRPLMERRPASPRINELCREAL